MNKISPNYISKAPNNIFPNQIQPCIKKKTNHTQVGFILGMQCGFEINPSNCRNNDGKFSD